MPTIYRQRISGTGTEKPRKPSEQLDIGDEDLAAEEREERDAEDHSIAVCEEQPTRRKGREQGMDR